MSASCFFLSSSFSRFSFSAFNDPSLRTWDPCPVCAFFHSASNQQHPAPLRTEGGVLAGPFFVLEKHAKRTGRMRVFCSNPVGCWQNSLFGIIVIVNDLFVDAMASTVHRLVDGFCRVQDANLSLCRWRQKRWAPAPIRRWRPPRLYCASTSPMTTRVKPIALSAASSSRSARASSRVRSIERAAA